MIGVIVALKSETPNIEKLTSYVKTYEVNNYNIVLLKILDQLVPIVYSGVGKANAAAATQLLIDHFKVNIVFNIGSCGAIVNGINVGDLIIPTSLSYYDVDAIAFGYKPNQIPHAPEAYGIDSHLVDKLTPLLQLYKLKIHNVRIATGETFIDNKNIAKYEFSGIAAVDMEATAIAQVCFINKVTLFVIKVVSDNIYLDSKNEEQ
jgi:adenosylhomocysteine nucleosidase